MKQPIHPLRSMLTAATLAALMAALAFIAYARFYRQTGAGAGAKPREWTYAGENGGYVLAVERDGSGRPNEWSFFDRDGHLLRFEKDRGGAGKVDTRDIYRFDEKTRREVIVRAERAEKCGAQFDTFTYFNADGMMERMERDRNCDGEIDVIAYFDKPNVAPYKIVWDNSYDGRFGLTTYRDGKSEGPDVTPAAPSASPAPPPSPR